MDDVIIIGGSFAGLTAASHLGRARRKVTILDTDRPRNRFAAEAHNVLGYDGVSPLAIREKALADVLKYPTVRRLAVGARAASGVQDAFAVELADGGVVEGRRLILAYGVTDLMPEILGFKECWGNTVFHCPYCHGYEVADRRIGILYSSPASLHATVLLADWTGDLMLLANGHALPADELVKLDRRGVRVVTPKVAEMLHEDGQLRAVRLADGSEVALEAVLAHPNAEPSSSLHEELGVETEAGPLGQLIKVDELFGTNMPGIFAAGDVANARQSINIAAYGGTLAAMNCHRSLLNWD